MIHQLFRRWARSVRGQMMAIFAVSFFPLIAATGFAIDAARELNLKRHAQSAVDVAALSGARTFKTGMNASVAETSAENSFLANIETAFGDAVCAEPTITTNLTSLDVEVTASCTIPTIFGIGISGKDTVGVTVTAKAAAATTPIEVALMFDLSRSINATELASLKAAAKTASTIVIAPIGNGRVSLVPFASGVNGGEFGNLAIGRAVGSDPEGDDRNSTGGALDRVCVTERDGAEASTDTDPLSSPVGNVITTSDVTTLREDYGFRVHASALICPDSQVEPLSDNLGEIHASLDGLSRSSVANIAGGHTAGHMGIIWSWYTLSPNWNSVWGNGSAGGGEARKASPYDEPELKKIAILMSDGLFQAGYSPEIYDPDYNTKIDNIDDAAKAHCAAMRSAGISIYGVGYQVPESAPVGQILAYCAGDPSRVYFTNDHEDLDDIYAEITGEFIGVLLTE